MGVKGWSLEVVRGREVGRVYPLEGAETVVGNALAGASGIDLAGQEGDSPRRMAARQAVIVAMPAGFAVRDLDSPGGTFVNRQRVLPGQSLPVAPGDTIQLGSVQLRVVATTPTKPRTESFSFRLLDGTVCRTWDDFLRVSAQKWAGVRDELTSGRLDAWLRSIGRPDLIASPPPGSDPDAHLDAWLARLPATRPAEPEIDVHPSRVVVQVTPGGGQITRTVRVSNVGHRLLRFKAVIDPPSGWVRLDTDAGPARSVIDAVDLTLTISIPETLPRPLSATLILGGNGGSKRVEIVLEGKAVRPVVAPTSEVRGGLALIPVPRRIGFGVLALVAIRLAVAIGDGLFGGAEGGESPGLVGPVIVFAMAAGLATAATLGRRGVRDAGFGAISGAIAGACLAALIVAGCRSSDRTLGIGWAGSVVVWGMLGSAIAWVSRFLVPYCESP